MSFDILDNGVKASYPESTCTLNTMEIPGITGVYEALQFHVHTSSEHTVDGEFFGAELHIVHKSTTENRFAVLGMLIEPKSPTDNAQFEILLDEWRAEAEATNVACGIPTVDTFTSSQNSTRRLQAYNAYDLVPAETAYFHYDGGLTTPPCSGTCFPVF